ncbi:MAG: hypothetical protein ABGY96_22900 [bacterium]|nr:hypothetical protein [Pseudomonadales bacterium]
MWLEIENNGLTRLRYAPTGTDREYFSPLEVSYKHRKGFSATARREMDVRFHTLALKRYLDPGETVSGFVFTHVEPGTKGFNVDLFGSGVSFSFTFFIRIPGFRPDHAEVDFESLYTADEVQHISEVDFYSTLLSFPSHTSDSSGTSTGSPANVFFVVDGKSLLYALIRAGWQEGVVDNATGQFEDDYFYFNRRQDTVFRYAGRNKSDGFYELRLWLSPLLVDGTTVWFGQLRQFISHPWVGPRPDPDVGDAQSFLVQNLWYSEALLQYGTVTENDVVVKGETQKDFLGAEYFTNGQRLVLWVTDDPVSMRDMVFWNGEPTNGSR